MSVKPRMILSVLLCVLLLTACGGRAAEQPQPTPAPQTLVDDAAYQLTAQDAETPLAGGELIAAVFNSSGPDGTDFNGALWRGVETFAANFGYTAKAYTAADDTLGALHAAFGDAVEERAGLIVCGGEDMAVALHAVQGQYPATNFLLIDAEPHNEDYSDYTATGNVHSVLFRVEQSAWLAGYAAVMDGNTQLAVAAAGAMPDSVRSVDGFIQGAEAGARQQGVQVICRVWYNAAGRTADEITDYVSDWYDGGVQVVFALNSTILQGCLQAVQTHGGARIITAGVDQLGRNDAVLTTAASCYSTAVQNKLYEYFAAGGTWGAGTAGQTVRLGVLENAVALPTANWRFTGFTVGEYAAQYTALRDNGVTVEVISDTNTLPATTNVEIWVQN